MLHFRIFGIPVTIHPSLWIVLALIGGGLGVREAAELFPVVLFVIAGFLSLFVHELGHALVGRWLNGSYASIEMAFMGGACQYHGGTSSRWTDVARTAAGAGFALLFGLVFVGILSTYLVQPSMVWDVTWMIIIGDPLAHWAGLYNENINVSIFTFLNYSIWVAAWWSALNLLPIFPMDGGQILGRMTGSYKAMHIVGIVLAGGGAVLACVAGWWFAGVLLGYFAFLNYKFLQQYSR